ncbi:MAG: hypothetical protein KF718_08750 [Polyangiaceae bacterium]|nr:hypothetical protein [Polyangiaceae bacterium]
MKVVVATHGHCFDGLASAAVFSRLHREVRGSASYTYRACGYGTGQSPPLEQLLAGDENAILDFRFAASSRLTWYFDHHRTAFATEADRARFLEPPQADRYFFDPEYSSCTKLVRDVGRSQFDWHAPDLDDLVHWADIIDAARFESAEDAISRRDPIKRLVNVVEYYGDDAFLERMVPELTTRPLVEVASSSFVEERYRPLGKKYDRFVERVRQKGEQRGRVVFVDLTETVLETVGKFVTYALFPDSVYSVIVGVLRSGAKISVGYNPWSGQPLDTDISAICARHGGGGHPVVGGISLRLTEVDRAREIALQIVRELADG